MDNKALGNKEATEGEQRRLGSGMKSLTGPKSASHSNAHLTDQHMLAASQAPVIQRIPNVTPTNDSLANLLLLGLDAASCCPKTVVPELFQQEYATDNNGLLISTKNIFDVDDDDRSYDEPIEMELLGHFGSEPVGDFVPWPLAVPQSVTSNSSNASLTAKMLGEDFVPGHWDVICGRGKAYYNHIGNKRLRILVASNLAKYIECESRSGKFAVVNDIVHQIRDASPCGGFVRRIMVQRQPDIYHWYKVGATEALQKVGHALRHSVSKLLRTWSKKHKTMTADDRRVCIQAAQQELMQSTLMSPLSSDDIPKSNILRQDIRQFFSLRAQEKLL